MLGRGATNSAGNAAGSRDASQAPTFRVPGASTAARAAAAATAGADSLAPNGPARPTPAHTHTTNDADGPTRNNGDGHTDATVDEDGFQVVRGRAWRRNRSTTRDGESAGDRPTGGHTGGTHERDASRGDDGEDGGEEAIDDGGDQAPDPEGLHQAWQAEVALVKRLRNQGVGEEHPVMRAACHARDAAEQQWRKFKDPTPAPVRLARAQAKLDRAISLQAEARAALNEHERVCEERRAVLQARLDEDTARVRNRRKQLDDIQEELASEGRAGRQRAEQSAAVRQVHGALVNEVAPTIATLVEQLDSATPAWSILNGLLATLTSSKTLLEKAIPAKAAQAFDIGDDVGDRGARGQGQRDEESEWSESHELAPNDDAMDDADPTDGDFDDDGNRGTDNWWEESHTQWQATSRWAPCGYGKWERSSWADSWEQEHGRGTNHDGDAPPAARRRLDDHPPPAAPAAAAAAPTDAERARLHRERVDLITQRAIDAGIQPITHKGEDLHVLDAASLDAWVAESFPGFAQD